MNLKKNVFLFFIILIFSCLIFTSFLNMHYATDTYNIFARGYKEYAIKYSLNDGRPMMCLVSLGADLINLPITAYIIILSLLAIITSCISILVLKSIIEKYKKVNNFVEEIILVIICWCTIFNFMFLENMQFAECFVMAVSILMYLLSAYSLIAKKRKNILFSTILTSIGILFYQGTLGFFVIMTVMFTILEDNKKIFKNIVISGLICCFAVFINLMQIRICGNLLNMQQIRTGNISNVLYMCLNIIVSIPNIFIETANIFPTNMFLIFVAISLLILFEETAKEKELKVNTLILVIITIGATFAINLFTIAGFGTARMMYGLGALIGNILILLYTKTNILKNKLKKFFMVFCVLYCVVISSNYVYIMLQHTRVENYTKRECNTIMTYIDNYEAKTKITLKNIAVYYDGKPTYYYKDIKNYSALCIRPLSVEWGDNGAISYWCNKELEEVETDIQIYESYFKDKNWDSLSEEQFVFIDDTIHYCIY